MPTKRIYSQNQTRGCRPSEVKGLRFAPIPSGLSPLTSFTPLVSRGCAVFSENSSFLFFGGTGSRTPCNGSVMTIAGLLRVERYLSLSLPFQKGLRLNWLFVLTLQSKHWLCSARREVLEGVEVLLYLSPTKGRFTEVVTFFHHPRGIPWFAGRGTWFLGNPYGVISKSGRGYQ